MGFVGFAVRGEALKERRHLVLECGEVAFVISPPLGEICNGTVEKVLGK